MALALVANMAFHFCEVMLLLVEEAQLDILDMELCCAAAVTLDLEHNVAVVMALC